MCLAISFFDENGNYELLSKLLLILNADKYNWKVGDADVYSVPKLKALFKNGKDIGKDYITLSGKELLSILNKSIYLVFIELYAFESLNKVPDNYEAFITSNCEIAIIIDDCKYYSLFIKNDAILPKIKRLLMDNSIREITILDKENADRLFGL